MSSHTFVIEISWNILKTQIFGRPAVGRSAEISKWDPSSGRLCAQAGAQVWHLPGEKGLWSHPHNELCSTFFRTGLWDKDLRWVRHIFLSILDQFVQIKHSHSQVSSINVTWIQLRYRYLQISWVTQPSWNRCDHLCKLGGVLNFRLDDYLWSWLCLCLCFCG